MRHRNVIDYHKLATFAMERYLMAYLHHNEPMIAIYNSVINKCVNNIATIHKIKYGKVAGMSVLHS